VGMRKGQTDGWTDARQLHYIFARRGQRNNAIKHIAEELK